MNTWNVNSSPKIQPLRNGFLDSRDKFQSNMGNIKETATENISHQQRHIKHGKKLKTKRPAYLFKPNPSEEHEIEEDNDDYDSDDDTDLKRDTGNRQLPENEMINADESSETNKNRVKESENKRDDGPASSVDKLENSVDDHNELTNRILEEKDNGKFGNDKRNTNFANKIDIERELVGDNGLNGIGNELSSSRHSMPSLSDFSIPDEKMRDTHEFDNKMNSQEENVEYKIEKRNDKVTNNKPQEKISESDSNDINKEDYVASPSKKRDENAMLKDGSSENDDRFLPQSSKTVKSPRTPNKTSLAAPKLTYYNENASSSELPSENTTPSTIKRRMHNGNFANGLHQFRKHHKITKLGRDPSHQSEDKLEVGNNKFQKKLSNKRANPDETSKIVLNNVGEDAIPANTEKKESQQKKSVDAQDNDGKRTDENVEKETNIDSANSNQNVNTMAKKSVESKTSEISGDSRPQMSSNSVQVDAIDPNLSKKRSVEMRDTPEEGSVEKFDNSENHGESPHSSDGSKTSSNIISRNSKNAQFRNGINDYNRQAFPPNEPWSLAPDTLSYRKSHHSNPHYPYAKQKYLKYDEEARNQKRVSGHNRPTSLEIKELRDPHNYEINVAKKLKGKVDEKLLRTMEDYKVKKTILKDANTRKETDIVENENEKLIDKVHVVSDPKQKSLRPPNKTFRPPNNSIRPRPPAFVDAGPIYAGEEENQEEEIVTPSEAEEEELEQVGQQNPGSEDYYEAESKEKPDSDNGYGISEDQEDLSAQIIPMSPTAEIELSSNGEDYMYETESNESIEENDDEEIQLPKDNKPEEVMQEYLPSAKLPPNLSVEKAPVDQIYEVSRAPPEAIFKSPKKNRPHKPKHKLHHGKGNKYKKIYQFSTEYAVSHGVDEFEKEEKLEKASKTVVRNKLMIANESSHHFHEKKTEMKQNKESYHESYIEEKDESKFPREMESSNVQRSAPDANHQPQTNSDNTNPNPYSDSDYPGSSPGNNVEFIEDQDYDDQPDIEYSKRNLDRISPSDELIQHENLIDNAKKRHSSRKISRDANTAPFSNKMQDHENIFNGRREANALDRESEQEMGQMNPESNFEDFPNINEEARDYSDEWRRSATTKYTAPHSESKSGNVVYVTMRSTTVDFEKKYHDFIQIQDDKRYAGRYARHPKHHIRRRRKNKYTDKKTLGS